LEVSYGPDFSANAESYNFTISTSAPPTSLVSTNDANIADAKFGIQIATSTLSSTGGISPFAVNFATQDGTATTADGNYVAASGMLNFGAGVNSVGVSAAVNGDTKIEANENFHFDLSNTTNSTSQGDGTIVNDDSAPVAGSISINDMSVTEGNSGNQVVTFVVSRSGGTAAFDVNFATQDGAATTADNDYVAASGILHFASGVDSLGIPVAINGDTKFEPNETFHVNLSGATNGATISDAQGDGTIVNDDAAPVVSVSDISVTEGNAGNQVVTFVVSRSGGIGAFDVNFATHDGTATTADGDYVAASGTLHFAANVNSMAIPVAINGDTNFESNEFFTVDLSGATNGATISDSQGIGTIVNDDNSTGIAHSSNFNGDYSRLEGGATVEIASLDDILWHNNSGQNAIWDIQDNQILGDGINLPATSADWHIVGVGDFNQDRTSDLLWYNEGGQIAIWDIQDNQILGDGINLASGVSSDWHVAGIGDFNEDGKSDILWHNDGGQNAIWNMSNN
jgi:hypothetical protein